LQLVFDELERDLVFDVGGETLKALLKDFETSVNSLETIKNPLTPQMAVLQYELDVRDGTHFNVLLGGSLEIPRPCLLTVRVAGQSVVCISYATTLQIAPAWQMVKCI
jgi:hypothetical protein